MKVWIHFTFKANVFYALGNLSSKLSFNSSTFFTNLHTRNSWGFTQIAFLLSFCRFSLNFTGGQSTIYQNNFKKWKLILWQRLNYVFQESHLAGVVIQQTALVSRGCVWIKREPATPAHKQKHNMWRRAGTESWRSWKVQDFLRLNLGCKSCLLLKQVPLRTHL